MNKSNQVSNQTPPKVAVCVVTYNQNKFVEECILSLVAQSTNFDFLILVSDDHSTDSTPEIIGALLKKYPEKIKYIRHEKNIGAYKNYLYTHAWAKSTGCQYIAHVDGDDMAMPNKLQLQVDLLDRNKNISLSAHAVKIIGKTGYLSLEENLPTLASTEDLLKHGAYFTNSSTMYRSINFQKRTSDVDVVDYIHYIEQSVHGKIHLSREILGAYRWHDLGISKSETHRNRIEAAYERAFGLAKDLGINSHIVERARLKRRLSFAIAALVDGRRDIFRRKVKLARHEWIIATWNHRALSFGRFLIRGKLEEMLINRFTGKS